MKKLKWNLKPPVKKNENFGELARLKSAKGVIVICPKSFYFEGVKFDPELINAIQSVQKSKTL